MILALLLLLIVFIDLILITALFIKSKNGTLRLAFIAFFSSLLWSVGSRFVDELGLLNVNLGLSLIPLAAAATFLTYYVYISPYNESK